MEDYIEKRRIYMRQYYMKNKDRYKNGKWIKKDIPKPTFYIKHEPVTITFR